VVIGEVLFVLPVRPAYVVYLSLLSEGPAPFRPPRPRNEHCRSFFPIDGALIWINVRIRAGRPLFDFFFAGGQEASFFLRMLFFLRLDPSRNFGSSHLPSPFREMLVHHALFSLSLLKNYRFCLRRFEAKILARCFFLTHGNRARDLLARLQLPNCRRIVRASFLSPLARDYSAWPCFAAEEIELYRPSPPSSTSRGERLPYFLTDRESRRSCFFLRPEAGKATVPSPALPTEAKWVFSVREDVVAFFPLCWLLGRRRFSVGYLSEDLRFSPPRFHGGRGGALPGLPRLRRDAPSRKSISTYVQRLIPR